MSSFLMIHSCSFQTKVQFYKKNKEIFFYSRIMVPRLKLTALDQESRVLCLTICK